MARVRGFEEQACTSVYYLSTAARCDRLAVALSEPVIYELTQPPSPPPAEPNVASPLPPPPPPAPLAPPGYAAAPVRGSRLSTVREPTVRAREAHVLARAFDDGYYMTPEEHAAAMAAVTNASLRGASLDALARCTAWQAHAPLPCVSAALETECIPGFRACASTALNTQSPFLELELSGAPRKRGNRLFGLAFELPASPELRSLFFESAEGEGGKGYQVQLYRADGSTVPCLSQEEQAATKLDADTAQHLFADGGATDAELYALGDAVRVRVTLPGDWRQIWLRSVRVSEVSLAAAQLPPRSPSPPPRPDLPELPPP